MNRNRIRFIVLFFAPLLILAVLTLLLPSRAFSPNENRPLAQMPVLSVSDIQSGNIQTGLSDYLSDQIPLRDFWIGANTALKKFSGRREINGIYLGDDHYYFQKFTDDSYSVTRMVSIFRMMDRFIQQQGIPATVMLVPSPGTVLSAKLPDNAPYYDADLVFDTADQLLSCPVIDLRNCFTIAQTTIGRARVPILPMSSIAPPRELAPENMRWNGCQTTFTAPCIPGYWTAPQNRMPSMHPWSCLKRPLHTRMERYRKRPTLRTS